MKRSITWTLINGIFFALLWFGLLHGMPGPRRVGLFMVWLSLPLAVVTAANSEALAIAAKKGRSVPQFVDSAFDLSVVTLLVWNGWIVSGVVYLLHFLAMAVVWDKADKLNKSTTEAPHV